MTLRAACLASALMLASLLAGCKETGSQPTPPQPQVQHGY